MILILSILQTRGRKQENPAECNFLAVTLHRHQRLLYDVSLCLDPNPAQINPQNMPFQHACPSPHCLLPLSCPEASEIQTTVDGRGQAIDNTEGNAAEEGRCHRGWLHLSDFIPFLALTILNPVQKVGEGR